MNAVADSTTVSAGQYPPSAPMGRTGKTITRTPTQAPCDFPILPRHGIYLFCVHGDGRRFARLFREAWRQLPLSTRHRLLKYWRQRRAAVMRPAQGEVFWPTVELVNDKSDFYRGNSDHAFAQYAHWKCSFAFHTAWMDMLPDHAVQCVIAHELAHAVICIDDAVGHLAEGAYDDLGFSQAEYDVDELIQDWGFDVIARDQAVDEVAAQAAGFA